MAGEVQGRTVRAVVTTYVHPDGAPRVGLRGEMVQVHHDHLAAFDKAEGEIPAVTAAPETVDENLVEPPKRRTRK